MRNYPLNSTPATHYTTAIAANGGTETETFPGLRADGLGSIKTVRIKSKENLEWQVEILNDDSEILYAHRFATTDATTIGGIRYYTASVDWLIPSLGIAGVIVGIRNMSGTAKTAGTNGALTLTLIIEK